MSLSITDQKTSNHITPVAQHRAVTMAGSALEERTLVLEPPSTPRLEELAEVQLVCLRHRTLMRGTTNKCKREYRLLRVNLPDLE